MVIATRVQDDFSSNALTSFALARPAGRSSGLRTDDPLFRTDLLPPLTHTQRKRDQFTVEIRAALWQGSRSTYAP
jgi:hypothetical protein